MEDPEWFIHEDLSSRFILKEKSIGPPTEYLGRKVSKVTLGNGTKCWAFISSQYIQNKVNNIEDYLHKKM